MPDLRLRRDFVESAGQTATRGIPHAANFVSNIQHVGHKRVQGSTVAFNGGFEFKAFALRENCDPVIAYESTKNHLVTWSSLIGGQAGQSSGTNPMPLVLMNSPSPLPFSTTLCYR